MKTPALSRRILPTYVPLRPEQERERVFEEVTMTREESGTPESIDTCVIHAFVVKYNGL